MVMDGMLWYGMVRNCAVWYFMVLGCMVRCGIVLSGMLLCMPRYWFGTVQKFAIQCGMVLYIK